MDIIPTDYWEIMLWLLNFPLLEPTSMLSLASLFSINWNTKLYQQWGRQLCEQTRCTLCFHVVFPWNITINISSYHLHSCLPLCMFIVYPNVSIHLNLSLLIPHFLYLQIFIILQTWAEWINKNNMLEIIWDQIMVSNVNMHSSVDRMLCVQSNNNKN